MAFSSFSRLRCFKKQISFLLLVFGLAFPSLRLAIARAGTNAHCHLSADEVREKETLRNAAIQGNEEARAAYSETIARHRQELQQCRQNNWPRDRAIWLRLYPCDLRPGVLETVFDRVVNLGYNQAYVAVFYDGQVLLPASDNPTPWSSVVSDPQATDLFALALEKARDRGLQTYAWLFTLDFGYSYSLDASRQEVLARNGNGETTIDIGENFELHDTIGSGDANHVFVDPYHPLALRDYAWLLAEIVERRPDGILFDYVRYRKGLGGGSVAENVKDLWIYGEASQQALYDRARNAKGRELIRRYLDRGYITAGDVEELNDRYPGEEPLWQGRVPPPASEKALLSLEGERQLLESELWYLAVAHAVQGVLDFLGEAAEIARLEGVETGAVFFPYGNRPVGDRGYDSRLQAWDRFPASIQWHPMAYAPCGDTRCILDEIQRVLRYAARDVKVFPSLVGFWGRSDGKRPSLEQQMAAIQRLSPQIEGIGHFSYDWHDPEFANQRKFCQFEGE